MSKWPDQCHVRSPELAPRLDVHTHLSLIAALSLLDPGEVHHGVNRPVRDFRRPLVVGAIEGAKAVRAPIQDRGGVTQIYGEPCRSTSLPRCPGSRVLVWDRPSRTSRRGGSE